MTETETIDTAALAKRVADAFQSIADDAGTIQVWNTQITNAEARALAALLRGVVDGPKVKPLEWNKYKNGRDLTASSVVGTYFVGKVVGSWTAFVRVVDGDGVHDIKLLSWCNPQDAKAAVIADFKQRIRSALVLPTPPLSTTKEG